MQRFFFATEGDLLRIPGLNNLFEKVDQVISDYLEEHKGEVDENEVRRFTAGHNANDDLVETEGNFKVLGKHYGGIIVCKIDNIVGKSDI